MSHSRRGADAVPVPLVPATSSGLALLQAGSSRLDASAARTAEDGLAGDLPAEAVQQVVAAAEVALGASVLRTSQDVLGSLLDVRA